ncbi:hypothetical protein ACHQM5_004632 [Ranunculus cassubicifolius]
MKLWVRVLEARRLRATDLNGLGDPYVRIQLAEKKFKTKVVKKSLNPSWGEVFCFESDELDVELIVSVMDADRYFKDVLVGQFKLHIETVYDAPNKSLGTLWFTLVPKGKKKAKSKDCGQILLSILFSENNPFLEGASTSTRALMQSYMDRPADQASESSSVSLHDILGLNFSSPSRSSSSTYSEETRSVSDEHSYTQLLMPLPGQSFQVYGEISSSNGTTRPVPGSPLRGSPIPGSPLRGPPIPGSPFRGSLMPGSPLQGSPLPGSQVPGSPRRGSQVPGSPVPGSPRQGFFVPDSPETPKFETYGRSAYESKNQNKYTDREFSEAMRRMESKDGGEEVPSNLPGGMLLNESYVIAPSDLNILLFSPKSNFTSSLAMMKGNKQLEQEPWRFGSEGESLKRTVTYMRAPSEMMTAVVAIEEQTYLKANGKVFVVLVSVSTPDAMYGNTFKAETLYCITPGPDLHLGEKSSKLVVSWRINFLRSTMMKGMIEGGARKGFEEGFEQFASLLSQNVKLYDLKDVESKPETNDNNNNIYESEITNYYSECKFEEAMRIMESKDRGVKVPDTFSGALVDQSYMVAPSDLNLLLFSSDSNFTRSLVELKGNKELQQAAWRFGNDGKSLSRTITYMKEASNMMETMKVIEEQTYLKANGEVFAVIVSVSMPDAFYGGAFRTETLYCITPGPREKSSRLVISWRMNFIENTMMKGMVEDEARKSMKETFKLFTSMLSKKVEPVDLKDTGSKHENYDTRSERHIYNEEVPSDLASPDVEDQTDLTLATRYLLNFPVICTALMGFYVLMHILLAMPRTLQGLEFSILDFPDSFTEMIVCTILVLQAQRVLPMILHFLQDRVQKVSHNGEKAQGDHPVLTVALMEGSSLECTTKTEEEVENKMNVPSPEENTAFQKIFGLPSEELLINEFTCRLERTMLLHGSLFLSAGIIGFHADLFGNKTTFFFLWEDIEDIQVHSPTVTSKGSPSLIIILRQGKGSDAQHGAKEEDEGRLRFHFHTFVSFDVVHRTIMALWKAKSSSTIRIEESASFVHLEDTAMSQVYSSTIHVPVKFFMELFGGGYLDSKVMEKVGCLDYSHTPWELVKPNIYQRQICYIFDKHISHYEGEATATQQLSSSEGNGFLVQEVLTLHEIPLGDHFNVHVRYKVEEDISNTKACKVQIQLGMAWMKTTKHQNRITENVASNLVDRLKSIFSLVEREYTQEN